MKLTTENLELVFKGCLSDDSGILVQGLRLAAYLDRHLLDEHRDDILSMISDLPEEFIEGGGWSFLNMCCRRDGVQWTGEHAMCDKLLILAKAVGAASILLEEYKDIMPGGVPYISFEIPKS